VPLDACRILPDVIVKAWFSGGELIAKESKKQRDP
jgi:hypothetical protein